MGQRGDPLAVRREVLQGMSQAKVLAIGVNRGPGLLPEHATEMPRRHIEPPSQRRQVERCCEVPRQLRPRPHCQVAMCRRTVAPSKRQTDAKDICAGRGICLSGALSRA